MATATTKARATTAANQGGGSGRMESLIVEDNGGDYHWRLLDRDGNSLARSPSFASYEHAEDAARVALAGAARLDRGLVIDSSVDIAT